jgi:hypothetical protein
MGYSKEFTEELERTAFQSYRTISDEEIDKRFNSREIPPEFFNAITKLRRKFQELAWYIDNYIPNGPDGARARSVALTELESASHWAIKAMSQEFSRRFEEIIADEQPPEEETNVQREPLPEGSYNV